MKKKILSLIVLLFSVIALAACGETVVGEAGPKGDAGAAGKSAYEIAVQNGFSGTEEEWLVSLEGARGDKGQAGNPGTDGTPGKNGHEVEMIEEDGAMYWRRIPNEGENAELEEFQPRFLYYTRDYIVVEFYIGENLYKSMKINREDVAAAKMPTIADNDALIGMGYTLDGWAFEDGEEYEEISNHSAKVYAVTHYQGVMINVTFGNQADGSQYYAYDFESFGDYVITKFLADVGIEDATGFYTAYSSSVEGESGFSGPIETLVGNHPEYKWLFNFILANEGTTDNKRLKGLADKLELEFSHDGSSPVIDKYSYEFMANWIHNFLNKGNGNLHSGSATYFPAADFTNAGAFAGLGKANPELLAQFMAVESNKVTSLENVNNLWLDLPEGFAFFKVEGETKTEVAFQDLVQGESYLCEYKAN